MKENFENVTFMKSAAKLEQAPAAKNAKGEFLPEIAVAGRSNVGKSSLLNLLFRRKNLVKTSATPGKTQLLNFFRVGDSLVFADLPGYGFAQVPLSVRKAWGPMIQRYLEERPTLSLILFLFDIRRLPNEDDFLFCDWVRHSGKEMILVLTKTDKLTRSEVAKQTKQILEDLEISREDMVLFSVPDRIGRHELINKIKERCTQYRMDDGTPSE